MRERIGEAIGAVWAPAVAVIARAREARMFHPEGHTFTGASVAACEPASPYAPLAAALTGRVLGRCSAALWRGGFEHLDVLGLALRFRPGDGAPLDETPAAGDTDLLAATIRSPLTMLASPFFTDASDFAGNTYWAVSPFAPAGLAHRVELRLVPVSPHATRGTRVARLRAAVAAGQAAWWLEARRTLHLGWDRVCQVSLTREAQVDQAALAFDPFRGALHPVGVVHAIRKATYLASQRARPS